MYEPSLKKLIETNFNRFTTEFTETTLVMGTEVNHWLKKLAQTQQPANYFTHPLAFPMLLLPWWLEKACTPQPNLQFQQDLIWSTINGYYYIRLIDDVMDGDAAVDLNLLPTLNFFHTHFQLPYQTYFPPEHPFWRFFKQTWFQSGELAMVDATLNEITLTTFQQIAAQKTCAIKIPLVAICHHYQRLDLISSVTTFVDVFGCWHQMMNDLFDWHKDLNNGNQTYFLSEAKRCKQATESVEAWVIRVGFDWGCECLQNWLGEAKMVAQNLQSQDLIAYLNERERLFLEKKSEVLIGLQNIGQLFTLLNQANQTPSRGY